MIFMKKIYPFFSIIIPTYNRLEQLVVCLKALTALDYPVDHFEVIIIDDGSETQPNHVVNSFSKLINIKLIKQPHAGVGIGRNTGAAEAQGEFLVFTDDDCKPSKNWLKTLAEQFCKSPKCTVSGRTANILEDNIFSIASQLLIRFLFSYYNNNPSQAEFLNGSNFAVPKELFLKLGGFDKSFFLVFAEDREFCDRWKDNGYQVVYTPDVFVYHCHKLTFRTFLRQHFTYGRGAFYFHKARARRGHNKIQVEPKHFYLNLFSYPFVQKYSFKAPSLSILLLISQVSNAIGFFWERFICSNSN